MESNYPPNPRQFWLTNEKSRNEFRHTLSSLFLSMVFSPKDIWWVSPWSTEFDLLDNRKGDWNTVEPRWGLRYIRCSELAIKLLETGSRIRMVTRKHEGTLKFADKLRQATLENSNVFQHVIKDGTLHIKGMLTDDFWLKGGMNFTYLGTNRNDEQADLIVQKRAIVEARKQVEIAYGKWEPRL